MNTPAARASSYRLGTRIVNRMGYGAMQLAGPGVFGPPQDRKAALAVLREAVSSGVDHIDASDFYGPHVTNQLIREALRALIRHIGLSNVTAAQVAEGRRICEIVCVQNLYNLVRRADDPLVDSLAQHGIAYVPFFPLGGITPLQSGILNAVAQQIAATPMQVALAWLLLRAPNMLLIP